MTRFKRWNDLTTARAVGLLFLIALALGTLAFVACVLGCVVVIGDRNKVEAPDVRPRTEIEIGARKGKDEPPPLQVHKNPER